MIRTGLDSQPPANQPSTLDHSLLFPTYCRVLDAGAGAEGVGGACLATLFVASVADKGND